MDYQKNETPEFYKCGACGVSGIKLWREWNTFVDLQKFYCAACACEVQGMEDTVGVDGRRLDTEYDCGFTDQIGSYCPAVPTEDEKTFWDYAAVPDEGVAWWRNLYTRLINRHPKIGDTVISRTNEDEPYDMGILLGYDNAWHDPNREQFPFVEIDGKPFVCMGIVIKDDEKLREILDDMDQKGQWNYLSLHYKRK